MYEDIPANLSALKHRAEQVKFQHRIQELEAQGETPPFPRVVPMHMLIARVQAA